MPIHWFVEDGQPVSVNGDNYLELLEETVWLAVRIPTARKKLWFQQDCAPSHCTNRALAFLNEKLKSRVISRRCSVPWPAYSPDLNPLDHRFWGSIESNICKERPANITELKSMVEKVASEISVETITKSVQNILW